MGCGTIVLLSILSTAMIVGIEVLLGEELFIVLTVMGLIIYGLSRLFLAEEKRNRQNIATSAQNRTGSLTKTQDDSPKPEPVSSGDYRILVKNDYVEIVSFAGYEWPAGKNNWQRSI